LPLSNISAMLDTARQTYLPSSVLDKLPSALSALIPSFVHSAPLSNIPEMLDKSPPAILLCTHLSNIFVLCIFRFELKYADGYIIHSLLSDILIDSAPYQWMTKYFYDQHDSREHAPLDCGTEDLMDRHRTMQAAILKSRSQPPSLIPIPLGKTAAEMELKQVRKVCIFVSCYIFNLTFKLIVEYRVAAYHN
jgi:hypothetical protein